MIWVFIILLNALAVGSVLAAETIMREEKIPLYFIALILIVGAFHTSAGLL